MNINPADDRCIPFYEKMKVIPSLKKVLERVRACLRSPCMSCCSLYAWLWLLYPFISVKNVINVVKEYGMVLLCHTGEEKAVESETMQVYTCCVWVWV